MSQKFQMLLGYISLLSVGKLRKFDLLFHTVLMEGSDLDGEVTLVSLKTRNPYHPLIPNVMTDSLAPT